MKTFLVFDVESIGLHGEGFSVGYVVIQSNGETLQEGYFSCPRSEAFGDLDDREWVRKNIPRIASADFASENPKVMRSEFWKIWIEWKQKGALLAADCNWPVEARFLSQCVDDSKEERKWNGPYPFIDIGSVILGAGGDPLETFERLPREIPAHDPLNDARQSARILVNVLNKLQNQYAA